MGDTYFTFFILFSLRPSISRYGLGMIYYKQEKFNLAEIHFKKALSINPQSSVLLCHIGVVSGPLHCLFQLTQSAHLQKYFRNHMYYYYCYYFQSL